MDNSFYRNERMQSLETYLTLGRKQTFHKGQMLFLFDQTVDYLCYLRRGQVGRLVTAANGMEKYIRVVDDQGIVGEVMFFRHLQNSTASSFVAIEDCECWLFDEKTVFEVLLKDELVLRELIQWFCGRLHSLNNQVLDGLNKDSHYRVCKFLYEYVSRFGEQDEKGNVVCEKKLSHYDIAKYLGINRVTVTNIMKQLQETGIILKERNRMVVLQIDYLEEL